MNGDYAAYVDQEVAELNALPLDERLAGVASMIDKITEVLKEDNDAAVVEEETV